MDMDLIINAASDALLNVVLAVIAPALTGCISSAWAPRS